MKRRTVLRVCGAGLAAGLAGCGSGSVPGGGDGDQDRTSVPDPQGDGSTTDQNDRSTTDQGDESTTDQGDGVTTDEGGETTTAEQSDGPTTDDSGQETTTDGTGQETTVSPRLTAADLTPGKGTCGGVGSSTTVTFDDEAGAVVVEGSIPAPNPCYRPVLADAGYDPESDTLAVTVRATSPDETRMCVQCTGSVRYTARAEFTGGLPRSVTVVHDSLGRRTAVQETNDK